MSTVIPVHPRIREILNELEEWEILEAALNADKAAELWAVGREFKSAGMRAAQIRDEREREFRRHLRRIYEARK